MGDCSLLVCMSEDLAQARAAIERATESTDHSTLREHLETARDELDEYRRAYTRDW